jgi:hypothetical protein
MHRSSGSLVALVASAVILLAGCGAASTTTATPAPSPQLSLKIATAAAATPVMVNGFDLGTPIICQATPSKGSSGTLEIQGNSLDPAGYQVTVKIKPYRGDGGYVVPAFFGGISVMIQLTGPGLASAAASVGAGHYVNPLVAYQTNGTITVSDNGQRVAFTGQATTTYGAPAASGSSLKGSASC